MSDSVEQNESDFVPLLDELRQVRRMSLERVAQGMNGSQSGYEIIRELRRGGQGIVYEAIQRSTGRRVALKVLLHGGFRSDREMHRFLREVELLASLRHRSIVTLFDTGEINGEPYYAMEFIDGQPLNVVPELRIPTSPTDHASRNGHLLRVLKAFYAVCDAVACFQRNGLIHRDLKPDNILVDREGLPHVVDFGLARLSVTGNECAEPGVSGAAFTMTGEFLGTPAYASPEQALGDPQAVDIRSDVYSLGAILFELLTGQLPISMSGSIAVALQRITELEPVRPSTMNSAVDRDLDAIVLKCLAKDPDRRYQSAAELSADIQRWLNGQPIMARGDSTWYVIRKSLRKHKLVVTTATGFVLLLAVASVVSFELWRQAVHDRNEARAEAYVASLYGANAAQTEHRTMDAVDLLMRPAKELRGWEWHYVLSRIDHSVSTLKLFDGAVQSCASSSDRRLLAMIDTLGRIHIHQVADGSAVKIPAELQQAHPTIVAFRPGHAELLVAEQDGRIRMFDLGTSESTDLDGLPMGRPVALSFDSTGRFVALCLHDGEQRPVVCVWRIEDREIVCTLTLPWDVRALALSANADSVAVGGANLEIYRISDGRLIARVASPKRTAGSNGSVTCLTYSNDHTMIAAGSTNGSAIVANPDSGEVLSRMTTHKGPVSCLAFSDDSRKLATGAHDSVTRIWDLDSGRLESANHGHIYWISGVIFTGANEVASVSVRAELKAFRTNFDPSDRRLNLHKSSVTGTSFFRAGEIVITSSLDGTLKSSETKSGKAISPLISGSVPVTAIQVDQDQSVIVAGLANGLVRLFRANSASPPEYRPQQQFQNASAPGCLTISTETAMLATGLESGEISVRRIDGEASGTILRHHTQPVRFVSFLRQGTLLISEDETTLLVTDVATGRVRHRLNRPLSKYYSPVAIDPSEMIVAAGDSSGRINVWNPLTGHEEPPFQWHATGVTALCFSRDGSRLISAATDGSVKVWDVARRTELFALPNVQGFACQLDFSPDEKRIAAGLYDGTVVLFEAIPVSKRITDAGGQSDGR